jgi:hypothetical protein
MYIYHNHIGAVSVAATLISVFFIESIGRRPLLIIGTYIYIYIHICIYIYINLFISIPLTHIYVTPTPSPQDPSE